MHILKSRVIFIIGVTHFVCLMPNYELERFTPYQEMVKEIAAREKRKINFTQFPIEGR